LTRCKRTTFDEDHLAGFSYTMSYNLTGWPSVVVRGGTSPEGLPIGVQVVARPWREDVALALAKKGRGCRRRVAAADTLGEI
jgi:amidase